MINKTIGLNPKTVPTPLKPHYSNSIRTKSGPLLFISGQVGLDEKGELVGKGDIQAQAKQVLENLKNIVEANGGSMKDIVQVTVYVTDIAAFESISDIKLRQRQNHSVPL